jgi:carbonic anhydrase
LVPQRFGTAAVEEVEDGPGREVDFTDVSADVLNKNAGAQNRDPGGSGRQAGDRERAHQRAREGIFAQLQRIGIDADHGVALQRENRLGRYPARQQAGQRGKGNVREPFHDPMSGAVVIFGTAAQWGRVASSQNGTTAHRRFRRRHSGIDSPVGLPTLQRCMQSLKHLFEQNQAWAEAIKRRDAEFFQKLSRQQSPEYLWIGCADSRVPANEIVGMLPGEIFVHRNIANVVVHTDLNCLSVLQFAVDLLKIRHIMVVGHYGCGGVQAVIRGQRIGLADNWLRHVQDVRIKHEASLTALPDEAARHAKLCELNVVEQVANVCTTTVVQDAWARGQRVTVHGWIYGLRDGLLRDLRTTATNVDEAAAAYRHAIAALTS